MVQYEWDVETVSNADTKEYADGDVIDHRHTATFVEAKDEASAEPDPNTEHRLVLVCDDDEGRSWAYVDDGKLDDWFTDAYSRNTRKVPQRFHKEVARAYAS